MKTFVAALVLSTSLNLAAFPAAGGTDSIPTANGNIIIQPIQHATFALRWNEKLILVDPVGSAERFQSLGNADFILLTDIHGDHFNKETLTAVAGSGAKILAPAAVLEQLPQDLRQRTASMTNGAKQQLGDIHVEAIAAYNLTADRQKFHAKGRGNGYVLSAGGKRVYISGDTEGVPEMLALANIDVAFVCMNLPYTMDVEQAANAVKTFKPKIVYPYHSRGSDLEKFKQLVGSEPGIEVRLRDWYSPAK